MSGFIIPNNAPRTFSIQPVDAESHPLGVPQGTTFSSLSSDSNIATVSTDAATGLTTVTPQPVTGIVYITVIARLPDGSEISGCIDLHLELPTQQTQVPQRLVVNPVAA